MSEAITRTGKRGRPALGSKSIHLTLPPDQLAAVDAFAAGEVDSPSRPEAVRRLVAKALNLVII